MINKKEEGWADLGSDVSDGKVGTKLVELGVGV
jgi:hypothetical protein